MAFDPTTAKPDGFDPSTAKPAEEPSLMSKALTKLKEFQTLEQATNPLLLLGKAAMHPVESAKAAYGGAEGLVVGGVTSVGVPVLSVLATASNYPAAKAAEITSGVNLPGTSLGEIYMKSYSKMSGIGEALSEHMTPAGQKFNAVIGEVLNKVITTAGDSVYRFVKSEQDKTYKEFGERPLVSPEFAGAITQGLTAVAPFAAGLRRGAATPKELTGNFAYDFPATARKLEASKVGDPAITEARSAAPSKPVVQVAHDALNSELGITEKSAENLKNLTLNDKIKAVIRQTAMQTGETIPESAMTDYANMVVSALNEMQKYQESNLKPPVVAPHELDDPIEVKQSYGPMSADAQAAYHQDLMNSTPENNAVQLGIGPMGVIREKYNAYKSAADNARKSVSGNDEKLAQEKLNDLNHTWDTIFAIRPGDKAAHSALQEYIARNGNMSFDEAMISTGLVPPHPTMVKGEGVNKVIPGQPPSMELLAQWFNTEFDPTHPEYQRSLTRTEYGKRGERTTARPGQPERRHRTPESGMMLVEDPYGLKKNVKDLEHLGEGITKFAAAGLARPASDLIPHMRPDGNVTMWRATRPGQDTKLIPGAWVTDQEWVARDIYTSSHMQKYGKVGSVTSHDIPQKNLVKIHPNGYVYAPPGTNLGPVIRYIDQAGKKVSFNDLVSNLAETQSIIGLRKPMKKQGGWIDPATGKMHTEDRPSFRLWDPFSKDYLYFQHRYEAEDFAYDTDIPNKDVRIEERPYNLDYDKYNFGYLERGMLGTGGLEKAAEATKEVAKKGVAFQTQSAMAQRVKGVMAENRRALEASRKANAWELIKRARRGLIATDYDFRKALEKTPEGQEVMYRNVVKNGAGMAAKTYMDAVNGSVFDKLSRDERLSLDEMTRLRRIVQIDNYKGIGKVRHEGDITGPMATARLMQMREELGREGYAKIKRGSDAIFEEERKLLDMRLQNGIITPELHNKLKNFDYTRTEYLDIVDPVVPIHSRVRNMPTSIRGSGIGQLGHGKLIAVNMDSQGLLMEDAFRAFNTVFRNNALLALKDMATKHPDNGIVRLPTKETMAVSKEGEASMKHTPEGWTAIGLRAGGKQDFLLMKDEFADQFVTKPEAGLTEQMASVMRVISGSALVKYTSTAANPTFVLAGIPMDIWHTWIASSGSYSPHFPVMMGQMGADLAATAKDAFTKTGSWNDAMMEGIGSSFLTHESRGLADPYKSVSTIMHPKFQKLRETLSYLNEVSDMWIRLAYRHRLIGQGVPSWMATAMSRDRLDYYQGGQISKALDSIIPYTNVTIQATAKGAEKLVAPIFKGGEQPAPLTMAGVKEKYTPRQEALIKTTWVIGTAAAVKLAAMTTSPETDKNISVMDKVRNFNITFGDNLYVIDPSGNKRYVYVPIRLDQVVMPYNAAVVGGLELGEYGRVPHGLASAAVGQVSPISSAIPIPSMEAIATYTHNYDDFTDSPVYKGPKVRPEDEIRTFGSGQPTSPLAVAAGQALGLSPMRLQAAAGKVINPNNFYIKAFSFIGKEIFGSENPRDNATSTTQMLANIPGLTNVIKLTSPSTQQIEDLMQQEQDTNSVKAGSMRGLQDLMFQYEHQQNNVTQKTIETYINNQPPEVRKALLDHAKYTIAVDTIMSKYKASDEIPSKAWWVAASKINGDARGQAFYNVWVSATPEARQRMMAIAESLQAAGVGFVSDDFKRSFNAERKLLGDQQR